MIRMSDHAAEMCRKHCSDSMFFDRGEVVIEGTNDNGAKIAVVVDGHKRFMLCNVVYEDEAATEKILRLNSSNTCLEIFLNQKIIWTQERNYLTYYVNGQSVRLNTTDVQYAYDYLTGKIRKETLQEAETAHDNDYPCPGYAESLKDNT